MLSPGTRFLLQQQQQQQLAQGRQFGAAFVNADMMVR